MTEPSPPPGEILCDAVVAPGRPWGHRVAKGDMLRLIDLEGQQAVDFLCYDATNPENRYNAANTLKLNRSIYVGKICRSIRQRISSSTSSKGIARITPPHWP